MGCGTTPYHDSPEYFEWRALVFLSVYHMEYVCWWHPTAGFTTMMQLIVTHEEIWRDLIVVRQCFQTDVSATKLSLHGMWCCCHAYANFQSLYFTIWFDLLDCNFARVYHGLGTSCMMHIMIFNWLEKVMQLIGVISRGLCLVQIVFMRSYRFSCLPDILRSVV